MESYFFKALYGQWKNLEIQDQKLVRIYEDSATNTVTAQVIVPQSHWRIVLNFAHDVQTSGHLGICLFYFQRDATN